MEKLDDLKKEIENINNSIDSEIAKIQLELEKADDNKLKNDTENKKEVNNVDNTTNINVIKSNYSLSVSEIQNDFLQVFCKPPFPSTSTLHYDNESCSMFSKISPDIKYAIIGQQSFSFIYAIILSSGKVRFMKSLSHISSFDNVYCCMPIPNIRSARKMFVNYCKKNFVRNENDNSIFLLGIIGIHMILALGKIKKINTITIEEDDTIFGTLIASVILYLDYCTVYNTSNNKDSQSLTLPQLYNGFANFNYRCCPILNVDVTTDQFSSILKIIGINVENLRWQPKKCPASGLLEKVRNNIINIEKKYSGTSRLFSSYNNVTIEADGFHYLVPQILI